MLSTLTMNSAEVPAPGVELEKLLLIVQAGMRVRLRHHFFNWTQGPLQTLLPHDLLICVIAEGGGECHVESISCYPQTSQFSESLQRRNNGLAKRMMQAWDKSGRDPMQHDSVTGGGPSALEADYREHDLGPFVAHGTCAPDGRIGTFFGFCRLREPAKPQHAYIAELLVPYVHTAWARTRYYESTKTAMTAATVPSSVTSGVGNRILTGRELEILHWVYEGKSNMEIGMILGISGLTVKNHVQNILRKLNVQNRTQAVAKGLSLNLLQGHSHK